jgi:methylated-DNA-[protein]-cysteine S-methyltransferase
MPVTHTSTDSPLGELTLVAEDGMLTGVYFPHHWYRPDHAEFGDQDEAGFGEAERQLAEYFARDRKGFDLPLDPRGNPFQRRVWELISCIPYGRTVTYGDLARTLKGSALGDPANGGTGPGGTVLAKDVGAAVGRNPLSVIVPCHRVVGKDGNLTGYAGGLARKRFLLRLEEPAGQDAGRLF